MSEVLIVMAVGFALVGAAAAGVSGGHRGGHTQAFRLIFPRDVKAEQVVAFARSLSGLLPPWWRRWLGAPRVVFEVSADDRGISHHLIGPARTIDYVLAELRATVPGTRVEPEDPLRVRVTSGAELRLSSALVPLRTDQPQATSAGLLATLQPLRPNEATVV